SIELAADGGAPLVLDGVSLTASGIDNATDARAPFEIDIRDALGGVLRLEGDLVLAAAVADGRVIFENVDAGPVAARLFASPSIAGSASGSADFEWRDADGSLLLRNGALRLLRPEIDWRSGGA